MFRFTPLGSFDFIHARCIYGCVADYASLYAQVLTHLKPGGWFQHAEISVIPRCTDGTMTGTSLERWGPLAIEAGVKFGKSFGIAEDVESFMTAAGFVNIKKHVFPWPIGPWARDPTLKSIGEYNRLGWQQGLEGWALFLFTKFLGVGRGQSGVCQQDSLVLTVVLQWTVDEVQILLAQIRRELRDSSIHAYQHV